MSNRMYAYMVIALFSKETRRAGSSDISTSNYATTQIAESSDQAISQTMGSSSALDYIKNGFSLAKIDAVLIPSGIAPMNNNQTPVTVSPYGFYVGLQEPHNEGFLPKIRQAIADHYFLEGRLEDLSTAAIPLHFK